MAAASVSSSMSVTRFRKCLIANQAFRNANRNTVRHILKTTYNGCSKHVRRTRKYSTYSLYDVDVFGTLDADMKQISSEEIKRQSEE